MKSPVRIIHSSNQSMFEAVLSLLLALGRIEIQTEMSSAKTL